MNSAPIKHVLAVLTTNHYLEYAQLLNFQFYLPTAAAAGVIRNIGGRGRPPNIG